MNEINCILLVDDNPADNYYNEIIIAEAGICNVVKTVVSGEKALDYLMSSQEYTQSESCPIPDIIFLDINMPRMNGFEFLSEYKKLDQRIKSKVVIVMLTTTLNPDERIKALETNEVKDFAIKPLTAELVREIAEKYL